MSSCPMEKRPSADDLRQTAGQCRHYAMCKINSLGTGLCPAGKEHGYVSYYPQGRMDLYHALSQDMIPVTPELVQIAKSCDMCGLCDTQCHFVTGMRPLLEAVLQPSPETAAQAVEKDLQSFYTELYARPEMTDMVWLTMFRIVSVRMSRHKHMFAFLIYVPLHRLEVITGICTELERIAHNHGIQADFGFLTPLDLGKRAILEYDYYLDHQDPLEAEKIEKAQLKFEPYLDALSASTPGVKWLKYIFSQGCARKEAFLYT